MTEHGIEHGTMRWETGVESTELLGTCKYVALCGSGSFVGEGRDILNGGKRGDTK